MKKGTLLLVLIGFFIAFYLYEGRSVDSSPSPPGDSQLDDSQIERAFQQQRSDVQVQAEGTVTRMLSDDNEGSRHQRFIVELRSGQTLLISHNIDLAPRINELEEGDRVEFFGEYEWNPQGGVVHWTHHDPAGRHPGGWIKHNGRTYQ